MWRQTILFFWDPKTGKKSNLVNQEQWAMPHLCLYSIIVSSLDPIVLERLEKKKFESSKIGLSNPTDLFAVSEPRTNFPSTHITWFGNVLGRLRYWENVGRVSKYQLQLNVASLSIQHHYAEQMIFSETRKSLQLTQKNPKKKKGRSDEPFHNFWALKSVARRSWTV